MADGNSTKRAHNFKDLTGQRIGVLVVTGYAETRGNVAYWNVLCDCGATKAISTGNLTHGKNTSCGSGCPLRVNHNIKEETGNIYGKWKVLRYVGSSMWLCRCECGAESTIKGSHLRQGKSQQCRSCATKTHGWSTVDGYRSWEGMISRCRNAADHSYNSYGGRGITVCTRWESFEKFLEDMGPRPSVDHSIERINVDGNYEKSNCCWATPKEQGRNRRNNRVLTYNGRTLCVTEWAEELGIEWVTLFGRLYRGWSVKKSLTAPVKDTKRLLTLNGKTMCLSEWAEEIGINRKTLRDRLKRWSVEKSLTTPARSGKRKG